MSNWKVYKIPIIENEKLAWPERFTMTKKEAIEHNKQSDMKVISIEEIRDDKGLHVFNQEYLLQPIQQGAQIILPEWIHYYDFLIKPDFRIHKIVMAVDPAISEKESADCTAITVFVYDTRTKNSYCVDYHNSRMSFEKIKEQIYRMYKYWMPNQVIVEKIAAQDWLIQDLRRKYNIPVYSQHHKADKHSRLTSVSHIFEKGQVFFKPSQSIIVNQLVNFGSEQFDDIVDTVIDNLNKLYYCKGSRLVNTKHPF